MGERKRYRTFLYDSSRWDDFRFRPGDIVISTPAKCGTTWMQMLCALLIFRAPDLPAPLAQLSPWLDMQMRPLDDVVADLDAQTHRRFIKTHTPLDGIPFDPGVAYVHVARDPRDVALSWDNHWSNMDLDRLVAARIAAVGADDLEELGVTGPPPEPPDDLAERFWLWMDGDPRSDGVSGLATLVEHAATFWDRRHEPNVRLFHYADLRADLPGQMRVLAAFLGEDPPAAELVAAASFEAMKANADQLIPNSDTPFWQDNQRFFDRARAGGWVPLLDDEGERRYAHALAALAPPELAAWLHTGWLGGTTPAPLLV